jgi:hypothetical protein
MDEAIPGHSLSFALSTLAGSPCLQIGPTLASHCKKIKFNPSPPLLWGGPPSPRLDAMATWLCEDPIFFTLIRSDSGTLVFCHHSQTLYYASPAAQLAKECPVGSAFLCQFTSDQLPEGRVPRLLVFDLLSSPDFSPYARGERLRSLGQYLPQPLCCIQWIGLLRYLTADFVSKLPHKAEGLFCLGSDPCDLGDIIRPFGS